jgi:CDP-diacylglycerol--glycerol-3-phosphate 3-phosphatidyltransferase
MVSRRVQQWARALAVWIVKPLAHAGITPNMLTGVGLLLSLVTALVIAQGYLFIGGLLVLFAGIFDMFDGAVARVSNTASTFGAFLDSTLDRYSESVILFGLLLYALQHPGLKDALWPAPHEQQWMISFIFIAVVGSLMVSYTKARAEGLGIECKTGLLARPERVVLLALGLLSSTSIWALALLAVLSNVTAVERMITVWHNLRRANEQKNLAYRQKQLHTDTDNHPLPTSFSPQEANSSDVQPVHTSVPPLHGSVQQE